MANTVPVLSFTNTFGDLLSQQNRAAIELNNIGANNYTKDSGTLFLNGAGTGLSVTNAGLFGSAIVSGVLSVGSSVSALANVFINGSGNGLEVANNSLLRGNVVTNQITANTLIRTTTLNAGGNVYANDITSNNVIRTSTLNASGNAFVNTLQSNGAISGSSANIVGALITNSLVSNTSISGSTLNLSNDAVVEGSLSVGGDFVIDGTTVYNTNTFVINANSNIGLTSVFGVNRGSSGANAEIRWNESQDYWDIVDVNNPSSYSKILTANLISDSFTSTSSSAIASSAAVKNLNDALNSYAAVIYARANTSSNTFIGTTGSANSTAGITTFTSTNGVTIAGSANTLTFNTPQDVRTTASPTFNNLTLTNALSITQGGTSATSAAAALTNLLPSASGVPAGYVLATNGPGTYYWAAGGTGGGGGAVPGTTIQSTRVTATGNGAGLAYSTPVYTTGASQLRVYIDGVRQFGSAYTETSGNTAGSGIVTFNTSPATGTVILFEVDGFIINPYYANNITFTAPFGGIVSTANTIQLAIQDLETRKAALAGPTFTGIATSVTPSTDTSNTQIATTAFVKNSLNNSNTYTHSISGNAGTVTNGVYTTGDQTIAGTKTFSSTISGSINGNAGTATALQTARTINGTSFNGTADITVTAAAGTLTGSTLASGVTASSLTSVGTLTSGALSSGFSAVGVAQGGTGSSTLTSNAVLLGNGTSAVQTVAPGSSGNVLTSNGTTWQSSAAPASLGVGQSYTDFVATGGRALNTVYQNLTGKPIFVFVSGASSTATAYVDSSSNPTTVAAVAPAGGGAIFASMSFIVPNNFYYKVTGGFGTIYAWSELR